MGEKKKRNIIIGTLAIVLLLMAVGYAAFSTVLNINGTANISSKWDIHFDSTKTADVTGVVVATPGATGGEMPNGTVEYADANLTANLTANLKQPGDKVVYTLTVLNEGTLNAKLDQLNLTPSNNPAIKFTTSGLKVGDKLTAGGSAIITVTIEFDSDVKNQPESTTGSTQITLNFVQDTDDSTVITPPTTDPVLYRFGMDTVNIGDSVDTLNGTTEDYNTLGHNVFMKHTLNDGKVASTEVCFISGGLHCLKQESYEENKATLVGIYGEDKCEIDDTKTLCKDLVSVLATSEGDLIVYSDTEDCDLNSDGSSECFE